MKMVKYTFRKIFKLWLTFSQHSAWKGWETKRRNNDVIFISNIVNMIGFVIWVRLVLQSELGVQRLGHT